MPTTSGRARATTRLTTVLAAACLVAAGAVVPLSSASAAPSTLSVTPLGWNVVGLDSNSPTVATGPARYAVGAKVCNTGAATATDVTATWAWLTANSHVSILGPAAKSPETLAAGACRYWWWTVNVERVAASFNTARGFRITASAGNAPSVQTPANREIFVEKLISQNRNNVTGSSGPTSVLVGSTYTWTFSYDTGTFNQVQAGAFLDPSIFEISSVSQSYSTGGANDQFYKDACGWINDTTSAQYRSCTTNAKVGGTITSTVTAKVTGTGTTKISPLVLDFSGSSFHYNTDYASSVYALTVTATAPPAPTVVADSASTSSGTSVDVDVLANDVANGGSLDSSSLSVTVAPAHGTATVVGGQLRYAPAPGYSGTDTLTYRVCNTLGVCGTATVTITVTAPPVAGPDSASVPTAVATLIDVLANDSSAASYPLTITSLGSAVHGSVTVVGGQVRYVSAAGYRGPDSFTYTISDGHGGTATATVDVTVTNTAPTAGDDSAATTHAAPVTIDVLANDSDPNGDALTIVAVGLPGHGTAVVSSGAIVYTPVAGYAGSDTFTYMVSDGAGGTASAVVTVSVANARPVAADDAASTPGGTAVDIDVLANDTDPNADPLSITALTSPAHGTVSVVAGEVRYVPAPGYRGTDSFTYAATDGSASSVPATVTVAVANTPPVAQDDTVSTHRAASIDVLGNDSDANGDSLTVTAVGSPAHGSATIEADGTVTYIPTPGYTGSDAFTYTVSDGFGGTSVATVSVTVANAAPIAADDETSLAHGPGATTTYDVLANDSDPDADPLSLVALGSPSHGSAAIVGGKLSYTPTAGYVGDDVITYTVADEYGGTATATLLVHITNDAPVALDDSATAAPATAVDVTVLGNDTDANADVLTVTGASGAAHGTVTVNGDGTITYHPAASFRGTDSFTYTVSDGFTTSAPATVTVTVLNAAPEATDDTVGTPSGTPITISVLANDTDANADPLTITGTSPAAHGTVTTNLDGTVTYTPAPGYVGPDSFTYTVSDGAGGSSTATVTVTVGGAGPVAVDDAATTVHGVNVAIDVLANDSDPDPGDVLTVSTVGTPGHGTAALLGGVIVYSPAPGFVGSDSFTYVVADFDGGTATATVTVEVTNAAPAASDDTATTTDGTAVDIDVVANDGDPDGDPVSISVVGTPGHGSATVVGGSVRYTPVSGFVGVDTFTYSITDGLGGVSTATVTVTVTAGSTPPGPPGPPTPPGPPAPPTPPSLTATGAALCLADVPYVDYSTVVSGAVVATTVAASTAGSLTLRWRDSRGTIVATWSGLAASGRLVWPGAAIGADGRGSDWPGWVRRSGTWVPGSDGYEHTRTGSTLEFSSGSATASTVLAYPGATASCAPAPRLVTTRDSVTTPAGRAVTIVVGSNDDGVDAGARLTISGRPTHGTVVVEQDGTVTYTPDPGFAGTDTFLYTVTNANGLVSTASVDVVVVADSGLPSTGGDPASGGSPSASGLPSTGGNPAAPLGAGLLLILLGVALRGSARPDPATEAC